MEVENSPRAISNQLSAEEVSPETNIIETGLGMDNVDDVDDANDAHESSVSDNLSMITQTQTAVQQ
jgi:hypothetical protein